MRKKKVLRCGVRFDARFNEGGRKTRKEGGKQAVTMVSYACFSSRKNDRRDEKEKNRRPRRTPECDAHTHTADFSWCYEREMIVGPEVEE